MRIVIIGSGNVAYHLAKTFVQNNIAVVQIFGRNESELSKIAAELSIPFSNKTVCDADLYIIAVSDDAIADVSKHIQNVNSLVVHTSGSLPVDILQGNYRKGSLYPMQTFSKSKDLDYHNIPFFVEANNAEDVDVLKNLAAKISNHVVEADYETKKYIHLTAVFSCNFVNHLFARAKEIADQQNIPFDYFIPLINETVNKIKTVSPKEAQTGPARRNDERVLQLHEQLLKEEHLEIYKTLNKSIHKMYW